VVGLGAENVSEKDGNLGRGVLQQQNDPENFL
jgi:hypothetical protein